MVGDKAFSAVRYVSASIPVSHQTLTVLDMQYWNENSAGIVAIASLVGAVVAVAPTCWVAMRWAYSLLSNLISRARFNKEVDVLRENSVPGGDKNKL